MDDYENTSNNLFPALRAIVRAMDTRDIVSADHSINVMELACAVGEKMALPERELGDLRLAALFHDIGKIEINEIILCNPNRFSEQDHAIVKRHSEIGEKILLAEREDFRPIASCVRHCHEHFDGKGYPDGIEGSDIELNSRIISVADTYDFLCTDFPFRKAFSTDDAIQEIRRCSGTQFDPEVVKNFVGVIK